MPMKATVDEVEKYLNGLAPAGAGGVERGDGLRPENEADGRPHAAGEGPAAAAPAGESAPTLEPPEDLLADGQFAGEMRENLEALPEMLASRLAINHEDEIFEWPDGRTAAVLEGYLARWDNRRVRWDGNLIACLSRDGKTGRPFDGPAVECARCPHAAQCGFSPRVYLLPDKRRELWYLDVPTGQASRFYRYVHAVVCGEGGKPRRPLASVVTRIRLEKREGRRAARLIFEAVRPVQSREEWHEVVALRDELLPAVEETGGEAGPSLDDVVF